MLRMSRHRPALLLAAISLAPHAFAQLPAHRLDNGVVQARVSEDAGGRLLSFSLAGRANFLLVDEAAGNPDAVPDAASGNVPWMGHEVWVGPQNEWWMHQDVNPGRAEAKAVWPPDPYLSLSKYRLVHRDASRMELESPASPVSGVQLRKRYALVAGRPNSLQLEADATNRSGQLAARDIWFNTRVPPHTWAYVPVAGRGDIRIEPTAALEVTLEDGLLSLDLPAAGDSPRKGKLFIQPSQGWLAAFRDNQMFLIQFAHQARTAIHPAQGQVELYQDIDPGAPGKGLLELEVHAPYVELTPGARMSASERWTILPYDGPHTRAAHSAYLRRQGIL